ncbi:MAG TPA: alpha/beta hydrolase [Candidatus Binatia bacterium]|jgi:pimeloyl-ACP methyl ester carboxylesterase|nr:alpha/beta hydrolase [Candidatus Binatia bacterium]
MSVTTEITHRTVAANGLRFHVAECGTGDRLALCLHGFPECWYSWRHQMPVLAQLGYRVWAPDLRGYGDTERPARMEDYAIETLLDDVAGLIDAANPSETVLVAHDWGGVIAWLFAIRRVRPLARLVVMNLPHPAGFERELRHWRQIRRSWYALFFQLPALPELALGAQGCRAIGDAFVGSAIDKSRFPDDVLQVYRDAAARPGALTAMLNYYRAFVRGGGGSRQRALGYPTIETPTLLIWGEEDVALCRETTDGTEQWVRDLTVRYLPRVSHWVQQEAPETVNAMLTAWLTGAPVPQAGG